MRATRMQIDKHTSPSIPRTPDVTISTDRIHPYLSQSALPILRTYKHFINTISQYHSTIHMTYLTTLPAQQAQQAYKYHRPFHPSNSPADTTSASPSQTGHPASGSNWPPWPHE